METERYMLTDKQQKDPEFTDFVEMVEGYDNLIKNTIFIDELKNENPNIRLFCIKNLHTTSELLGVNRTEEELLPMLIDLLMNKEDNEEILIEIGNKLFELSKGIYTLKGLEILAGNDDDAVRENATEKLCQIISMSDEHMINLEIFPLMKRLIDNDIKSKVSCCYLFPCVYPKLDALNVKGQLLQAYFEISKEDAPCVRKAAAFNIRKFAENNLSDYNILKEMLTLLARMIKDSVDIVRAVSIESAGELLKALNEEDSSKLCNLLIEALKKEESWRVKYACATILGKLSLVLKTSMYDQEVVPILSPLLFDGDPEVKVAILNCFEDIIVKIGIDTFNSKLFDNLKTVGNDSNQHVKAMYFKILIALAKFYSPKDYLAKVAPLLIKSLKEDHYEVKVNSLSNLDDLTGIIEGVDNSQITEILSIISKDPKWRIRLAFAEKLVIFYNKLDINLFMSYIWSHVCLFFSDNAFQIREEAIKCLVVVSNRSTNEFITQKIIPLINTHSISSNYNFRSCSIITIEQILLGAERVDPQILSSYISILSIFKNDKVANVRFTLAKAIKSICNLKLMNKQKDIIVEFTSILSLLGNDLDSDVKYFAEDAQQVISTTNK